MEFKVGDRVRYAYDGAEGYITSLSSHRGTDYADVDWSDGPAMVLVDDIELTEGQPNRSYYETDLNLVELMSDPGPAIKSYGGSTLKHPRDTPIDPDHYKFPGGAEVIHISQWLTANAAQALQYVARSSRIDGKNKGDASEDIRKAITFLEFELKRLEGK